MRFVDDAFDNGRFLNRYNKRMRDRSTAVRHRVDVGPRFKMYGNQSRLGALGLDESVRGPLLVLGAIGVLFLALRLRTG